MATFSKPSDVFKWSTGGTITTPTGAKQIAGWAVGEKPPAEFMNWLQNGGYQWYAWLNERVFDGANNDQFILRSAHASSNRLMFSDDTQRRILVTNPVLNSVAFELQGTSRSRFIVTDTDASSGARAYSVETDANTFGLRVLDDNRDAITASFFTYNHNNGVMTLVATASNTVTTPVFAVSAATSATITSPVLQLTNSTSATITSPLMVLGGASAAFRIEGTTKGILRLSDIDDADTTHRNYEMWSESGVFSLVHLSTSSSSSNDYTVLGFDVATGITALGNDAITILGGASAYGQVSATGQAAWRVRDTDFGTTGERNFAFSSKNGQALFAQYDNTWGTENTFIEFTPASDTLFLATVTTKALHFIPNATASYDLGTASVLWRDIFAGGLTLSKPSDSDVFITISNTGRTWVLGSESSYTSNAFIIQDGSESYPGYVCIGGTQHHSFASESPGDYAMDVQNFGGTSSSHGLMISCGENTPTADFNFILFRDNNGTDKGRIYYNFGTGNVTLDATSDASLKKDIEPTKVNALDALNALQLRQYRWIDTNQLNEIGFVAQECLAGVPRMVSSNNGLMSISHDTLVPYLVKAVQELSSQIETLKAQI